jgi:hypothetical protein
MVALVMERLGAEGSGWFASSAHGIDTARLRTALDACTRDGRPVCILGTSFSFVHWLDELAERDERLTLPPGSRLMDTGGYKGRSRDVPADELRAHYHQRLGIAPGACINEYGMTELCSQFYDSTLADPRGARRKLAPPWVRTRVVDPDSLEEVPAGGRGLLQHVDLANLGSVMAVQTEDVGERITDGFLVHGRATGSIPRGCSIAMDELLAAARHR